MVLPGETCNTKFPALFFPELSFSSSPCSHLVAPSMLSLAPQIHLVIAQRGFALVQLSTSSSFVPFWSLRHSYNITDSVCWADPGTLGSWPDHRLLLPAGGWQGSACSPWLLFHHALAALKSHSSAWAQISFHPSSPSEWGWELNNESERYPGYSFKPPLAEDRHMMAGEATVGCPAGTGLNAIDFFFRGSH